MPHSLKSKIKSLCYKDEITEKERDRLIHALEQEQRDCKTCKHSDKGNCAGTEECHECMWDSKYEQQPCEDCISREAVIEWLKDKDIIKMNYQEENARRELAELPSVTPQRPKGKWIEYPNGYVCSECEILRAKGRTGKYNYCPNCGADMRGEEE